RQMYVGMTRAKHTLRLSYTSNVGTASKVPTEFITNIQDMLEKESEPFTYDINSFWQERTKSLLKRDYDYNRDFCSMVDNRILGKAFSPSSINTYLNCPRQYLYDYILGLRAKDGNPDNLSFGSAVHCALEYAVKIALETNNYPTEQDFINTFKNKLENLPLSSYEQREILQIRGQKALTEYYTQLCNTPVSVLRTVEQPVKFEMDGVKFYGIIDRIDKNSDGTYTIYDYKTGNAKTNRQICPDGEYENYYNQMGLYKYYFEKSTGKKVTETIFIFPEDYSKNLTLNLTDEDCLEIENKFKTAISNIKSYNFEPTYKKDACKHCQYKDFCNMEII
ncbi:MAG: PD-(D/E)XK nuclease family protein, partial [Candidatus Gastranaerophilales bacterium]|nr:PD-(D/E)XK nuclease family protein [Candidatus Gastranaerophilales bacterium]